MNKPENQVVEASKVNKATTDTLPIHSTQGAHKLTPENMSQAMEVAKMMSVSGVAVPPGLRNNAGACLAVAMKAWNWAMEPYSVASKVYVVKSQHGVETLAYESQLVHAVVNARAPLQKRLRTTYEGEGPAMTCTVTGHLDNEEEPFVYTTPPLANIGVKNSPLWKNDVEQQMGYYAVRAWARRFVPEVIMGVYTVEEIDERANPRKPEDAKDITPRPEESEYEEVEPEEEPADFEMISQFGEEIGTFTAQDFAAKMVEEAERLVQIGADSLTLQQFLDNNHAVLSNLPNALRIETGGILLKMYEELAKVSVEVVVEPEPEPEPEIETAAEVQPEPEFIEWWTPSGKWKFRNLQELVGYVTKTTASPDIPLETYRDSLKNNAEVLAGLVDGDGKEPVEYIKTMLSDKIAEMEAKD